MNIIGILIVLALIIFSLFWLLKFKQISKILASKSQFEQYKLALMQQIQPGKTFYLPYFEFKQSPGSPIATQNFNNQAQNKEASNRNNTYINQRTDPILLTMNATTTKQIGVMLKDEDLESDMYHKQLSLQDRRAIYEQTKQNFLDLIDQRMQGEQQLQNNNNIGAELNAQIMKSHSRISTFLLFWHLFNQMLNNFVVWKALFCKCEAKQKATQPQQPTLQVQAPKQNIQTQKSLFSLPSSLQLSLLSLQLACNLAVVHISTYNVFNENDNAVAQAVTLAAILSILHFTVNFIIYQKVVLNSIKNTIQFLNYIKFIKINQKQPPINNKFANQHQNQNQILDAFAHIEINSESSSNLHNSLYLLTFCAYCVTGTSLYLMFFKYREGIMTHTMITFFILCGFDLIIFRVIITAIYYAVQMWEIRRNNKSIEAFLRAHNNVISQYEDLLNKMEELFDSKQRMEELHNALGLAKQNNMQDRLLSLNSNNGCVSGMQKTDQFVMMLKRQANIHANQFNKRQIIADNEKVEQNSENMLRRKFPRCIFVLHPKEYDLTKLVRWQRAVRRLIYSLSLNTKFRENTSLDNKRPLFSEQGQNTNVNMAKRRGQVLGELSKNLPLNKASPSQNQVKLNVAPAINKFSHEQRRLMQTSKLYQKSASKIANQI